MIWSETNIILTIIGMVGLFSTALIWQRFSTHIIIQASNNIRKFTLKNRKDSQSLTSDCPYDHVDYKMMMTVEAAMLICGKPDVFGLPKISSLING